MTHNDWLQTLAEIGIGFAGFSALITGMRGEGGALRIQNAAWGLAVVETSLAVLFGAMAPVVLHGLGLSEITAFRFSGGIFLLVGTPLTVRGYRRGFTAARDSLSRSPTLIAVSTLVGGSSLAFGLACAVGAPAAVVPTYYLAALICTLGIAAFNFTGFVFAIEKASLSD